MRTIYILFFASLTIGCRAIQPEAPEIAVEAPTLYPETAPSVINVPLRINLKPYFQATDESIDKVFTGEEQQCEGVSYRYKFVRKPIQFKGVGEKLHFDVDGAYSLWLNYCVSCSDLFLSKPYCLTPRIFATCGVDEPMRKIHVGYATEIGIASNYFLTSKTTLRKLEPESPCKITVFDYDATSTLKTEVRQALKDLEKDIDAGISSVSLRPDLEEIWKALQTPTDLEGYGFLELQPKSLALGKINYVDEAAYVSVQLMAQPKVVLVKNERTIAPLPNLSAHTEGNGFDVITQIDADYDSLSALLTRTLKGTSVEIKGKHITFDSVAVYGASHKKLHIRVGFSGSKRGVLYLTGTPTFDAENQQLSFPDLEFDVKTKSALLKGAKWLFDRKITDMMRSQATIVLTPHLETLRKTLHRSINGPLDENVKMWGKVNHVTVVDIHPLETSLFLRVKTTGTLNIAVD